MKIKQVEAITGITAKNIRFYEQQGLLSPARNSDNGYRDYDESDVYLIKTIKMLRKLGMPLENIREVLSGTHPLAEVMHRQSEFLAQSIQELEAARKLCDELAGDAPELASFDVDYCLDRISNLEQQGGRFASIVNDFVSVAQAIEKMRFHFYPSELITTPAEFTTALFEYADEQKLDMTITKESMYPEFVIDGVSYKAHRYGTKFGSVISVEAMEPEGLMPRHIPRKRRFVFEWVWRVALPLLVLFILSLLWLGGFSVP